MTVGVYLAKVSGSLMSQPNSPTAEPANSADPNAVDLEDGKLGVDTTID